MQCYNVPVACMYCDPLSPRIPESKMGNLAAYTRHNIQVYHSKVLVFVYCKASCSNKKYNSYNFSSIIIVSFSIITHTNKM